MEDKNGKIEHQSLQPEPRPNLDCVFDLGHSLTMLMPRMSFICRSPVDHSVLFPEEDPFEEIRGVCPAFSSKLDRAVELGILVAKSDYSETLAELDAECERLFKLYGENKLQQLQLAVRQNTRAHTLWGDLQDRIRQKIHVDEQVRLAFKLGEIAAQIRIDINGKGNTNSLRRHLVQFANLIRVLTNWKVPLPDILLGFVQWAQHRDDCPADTDFVRLSDRCPPDGVWKDTVSRCVASILDITAAVVVVLRGLEIPNLSVSDPPGAKNQDSRKSQSESKTVPESAEGAVINMTQLAPAVKVALIVYKWALQQIEGAEHMTYRELHNAIRDHDDERPDGLPKDPKTFEKYLRRAGIKKYSKKMRPPSTPSIRHSSEVSH